MSTLEIKSMGPFINALAEMDHTQALVVLSSLGEVAAMPENRKRPSGNASKQNVAATQAPQAPPPPSPLQEQMDIRNERERYVVTASVLFIQSPFQRQGSK